MKTKRFLRSGLIYTLILSLCLTAVPKPVQASPLDPFISFLEQVEGIVGPGKLPFSSQQVRDVEGVIECLGNAGNQVDVAICIDQFHDTASGQSAGGTIGIPDWVYQLLDCYIMYESHQYYDLALTLGEAAFCAVLSLTVSGGSVNVCGLLEELVELAGTLWDAGKALVEWASSVGGDVYDAIKGAACGATFGLVGCDDEPETPPEVWVYTYIFDPKLAEGVAARKSQDQYAFDHLVDQLRANAAANPPVYSIPLPIDPYGMFEQVIGNACAKPWAVDRAVKVFTATVNTMWTADLGQNVLPLRSERFNQYNNPTNVNFLTLEALQSFKLGQNWDPRTPVVKSCEQRFVNEYKFAPIDRWLGMVNELGPDAQKLKPAVQTNYALCNSFWELRKNDFASAVYDYIQQKYCGSFGNGLMCSSVDKYRTCTGLLKPFGDNDKCGINTLTAGKEAADKVMQEITKLGTAFPNWQRIPPESTFGLSGQPYKLVGHRPTHAYYCETIYQNYFRDIPTRLLSCSQNPDTAYKELVAAVNQAVVQINQQGASCQSGLFIDPLAVLAATPGTVNELQQENRNFGFKPPSLKPGFDYSTLGLPESVDGLKTPLIFYDLPGKLENMAKEVNVPVQEKIPAMVDPLGPISDKLSGLHGRDELKTAVGGDQLQTVAGSKVRGISPTAVKGVDRQHLGTQLSIGAQQMAGAPAGGTQHQTMSGTVPAGQLPSKPMTLSVGGKTLSADKVTAQSLAITGLADLQPAATIDVDGKKVRWNGMLSLDAADLQAAAGGRCSIPIVLTVKNTGTLASAACQVGWSGTPAPLPLAALAPGEEQTLKTTLSLPTGVHRLQLQIDKLQQVKETDEQNNTATLTVRIAGSCGDSLKRKAPTGLKAPQQKPLGVPSVKPLLQKPTDPPLINPQPEPPGSTFHKAY